MVVSSFTFPHPAEIQRVPLVSQKMKEHGCLGPCASTWRNESRSCLKTAVALRLLHSTHYYQEILTFSIKGKRGGTERLTSKGVWLLYSSPWSCQLFPRYHLFQNSLPGWAAASPPPGEPSPHQECILSRQPATKTKELTRCPQHRCPWQGTIELVKRQGIAKESVFSHNKFKFCLRN